MRPLTSEQYKSQGHVSVYLVKYVTFYAIYHQSRWAIKLFIKGMTILFDINLIGQFYYFGSQRRARVSWYCQL